MDIKDIISKKRALQTKISQFVENEIDNFQRETGCCISNVYINIEEITTIGKPKTFFVLGTTLKLDLDD